MDIGASRTSGEGRAPMGVDEASGTDLRSSTAERSLRIAMIGQKGLPATFGGIEHHVEELGSRLAARGHDVTIFCRQTYGEDEATDFRGMRLRHVPTIGTKHLDAIAHSAAATFVAMRDAVPYDVIHYHAEGPGMLAFAPRLASKAKVVVTIHGLDHDRAKWGGVARAVLRVGGWMSAHVPDATVTVSRDLTELYASRYGCPAVHIPNGVTDTPAPRDEPAPFGLGGSRYVLFVGRLVPEKRPDDLIRAFRAIPGDVHLVIAGESSFTASFAGELRDLASADDRVLFPGYVFGDELRSLYRNAGAFVLPSSLEGMPLTLLEAIASGTPVIVSDIPPNVEVVGYDAPGHRVFRAGDVEGLRACLISALSDPEGEKQGVTTLRRRVLQAYSWDAAADATERLYARLASAEQPEPRLEHPGIRGQQQSADIRQEGRT